MKIKEVDLHNRTDIQKFINFPYNLYRQEKNWVPPLISDMRFALNIEAHPFYQHSKAAFFTVEDNKNTFGRIAVLKNQRYIEHTGEKTALYS